MHVVGPVAVPNGSLSVSHPPMHLPGGLGPYACLVHKPGLTGQDPASLTGTRVCASVCVCASICYNRGELCDTSPLTPPLWERMYARGPLRFRPADVVVCDEHIHIDVFMSGPTFIYLYKHLSCPPPIPFKHTENSKPPPHQSVCSLPDGVPGSPLTPAAL